MSSSINRGLISHFTRHLFFSSHSFPKGSPTSYRLSYSLTLTHSTTGPDEAATLHPEVALWCRLPTERIKSKNWAKLSPPWGSICFRLPSFFARVERRSGTFTLKCLAPTALRRALSSGSGDSSALERHRRVRSRKKGFLIYTRRMRTSLTGRRIQ